MGEAPDLAEDMEYWADWVMTHAQAQIGECYPVDEDGAVPVAYLWAKTIQCPHCGGEVPLIRRRWLHKRKGKTPVAYRLHVDREAQTYTVEIVEGPAAVEAEPERGTMRGATVECPYCGTPTERERIAEQGRAGQMGQHLLVVVLNREDETGREFRAATEADHAAFRLAEEKLARAKEEDFDFWGFERLLSVVPDEPTPAEGARSISIRLYGVESWGDLFNARQLLTLVTFGQQIRLVRDLLAEEGEEYAKAIALYLSILVSRYITRNSRATTWDVGYTKLNSIFARHDPSVRLKFRSNLE